jgi:hypothetical protein
MKNSATLFPPACEAGGISIAQRKLWVTNAKIKTSRKAGGMIDPKLSKGDSFFRPLRGLDSNLSRDPRLCPGYQYAACFAGWLSVIS